MRRVLLLLALLLAPFSARALESAPVVSPQARASLVADHAVVAPGTTLRLAFRLELAPGWHSYWLNPGDAGLPPELALTLPEGATATPLAFPTPERLPVGPLMDFGYRGTVLFPFSVTVPATAQPSTLQRGERFVLGAEARYLVCERVCIPEEAVLRLDFPVGTPALSPHAATLDAAQAALPRANPFTAQVGFAEGRARLVVADPVLDPATVRDAQFFPAAQGVLDNPAPQVLRVEPGRLTLDMTAGATAPAWPLEGVLAITDGAGRRVGYAIAASQGAAPPPIARQAALALWQAVLFAALGGLILNLMPCVFPILAMKAMALAQLGGAQRRTIRAEAGSYTLGVVASFLALAALLLGLRAAGVSAGWGFQLQSPWFVAVLAWLMLAVGLNLSGVFALGGPVGVGQGLAARGGHVGSFATGALAVLVATPCTAPFMAAALGAAFLMPWPATLAVFLALGLGMAAPYALLALFPGLAARLPRPGAWMERLKQFLAFPMYAAAAWLLWVLAQQAGPDGLALGFVGALLVGLAAWLAGLGARLPRGGAVVAVVAALALLPLLAPAPPRAAAEVPGTAQPGGTEPWSAARVAELQAQGRPVFVNMTAAWCISCKVNERVALDTATVQGAFAAGRVAYLKGDWTRGDPAITALLRAQGREGVPLYLLYPAGGGAPKLLPEILTPGIVLAALEAGSR
jgi:thiol:disulfide interchange protein